MQSISHKRSCPVHSGIYVTYICLKKDCICAGILCEQCIRDNHRHVKVCKIDSRQPPLSFFNINSNRTERFQYFQNIRENIGDIWNRANQMLTRQKQKIQQTILFQLNLICNTFVQSTPEVLQQNFKFQEAEDQNQTQQITENVNLLRTLHQNIQVIQNIDQIEANTQKVYNKIADSLKQAFNQLQKSFHQLDLTLSQVNIFQKSSEQTNLIKTPKPTQDNKQQTSKIQKPISKQTKPTAESSMLKVPDLQQPIINYKNNTPPVQTQKTYKQNQKMILLNSNLSQLPSLINNIKYLKIKQCRFPQIIFEHFLDNNTIEYLIIQQKKLATSECLHIILQCLRKLKVLVIHCNHQLIQCVSNITHFDEKGHQTSLDRLQYFYDFKRDLQSLDQGRYFPLKMFSTKILQQKYMTIDAQLPNSRPDFNDIYWDEPKSYLSLKQTLNLQQKFNLKNIWIADLNKNNFISSKQLNINLKNIEEVTLGYHDRPFLPIPALVEAELTQANNLRSLVLIRTSHFVLNLGNLLKKLTNLQVLVLEQFKCEGLQKDIIKLYNSIGSVACPYLQKLLITDLKNVSLNFISNLPFLTTLILPRSKNLQFDSQKKLFCLQHLNLYHSDWNYCQLLDNLLPTKITHLNIGLSKLQFKTVIKSIENFTSLESLCLDAMTLDQRLLAIIHNNQRTITRLSIALCNSSGLQIELAQTLNKCKSLSTLDIHKFDKEQEVIDNYPLTLKTIIVSSKKPMNKLKNRQILSTTILSIVKVDQ